MPRINLILCSGVFIMNAATLVAQTTKAYQSFTKATQYQFQQQRQWQLKQLPSNSILYKYNSYHVRELGYNFAIAKTTLVKNSYAPIAITGATTSPFTISVTMMPPELRHYLQANQSKYSNEQKQAWWRDPAHGFITPMLKDYRQSNKSILHL